MAPTPPQQPQPRFAGRQQPVFAGQQQSGFTGQQQSGFREFLSPIGNRSTANNDVTGLGSCNVVACNELEPATSDCGVGGYWGERRNLRVTAVYQMH